MSPTQRWQPSIDTMLSIFQSAYNPAKTFHIFSYEMNPYEWKLHYDRRLYDSDFETKSIIFYFFY